LLKVIVGRFPEFADIHEGSAEATECVCLTLTVASLAVESQALRKMFRRLRRMPEARQGVA
jgi:hypothetical protein